MSDEIKDYGAKFVVDREVLQSPGAQGYIEEQVRRMEMQGIYQAVKQADKQHGWICIKPEIIQCEHEGPWGNVEYSLLVHCRSVQTERVYIPVFEQAKMPRDVFKCSWCGGYTKNDKRGHCAGCGGPRNDQYIDDLECGL